MEPISTFTSINFIERELIKRNDINIIWSRDTKDDSRFKLIDFGLAHKFAKNKEVRMTALIKVADFR